MILLRNLLGIAVWLSSFNNILSQSGSRRRRDREALRGRDGVKIRVHTELDVYKMAFEAANEIYKLTCGFTK